MASHPVQVVSICLISCLQGSKTRRQLPMASHPVQVVSHLLHKYLILLHGDLLAAIGDVQRTVIRVQLARMHPALVGRSTNGYVRSIITLTTHNCLSGAFSIAGSLESERHP